MLKVDQLTIYPVKSMQGITLQTSLALPTGLQYDRLFMVSDYNGHFITAREKPQLLQLKTTLIETGIEISYLSSITHKSAKLANNAHYRIQVNYADFSPSREYTQVWNSHFTSHIAPISVNQFLSDFLQDDVQLRWIGNHPDRQVKRYPTNPLGFADGHPYLLINKASFIYLQQRCPQKLNIEQFRANIIIDGSLPFAEDGWKTIKIGNIIFDIVKPCSRCVITQINLTNQQRLPDDEPLKTLRSFRLDVKGDIDFGMKMVARNNGYISVGDPIDILASQPVKTYQTHPVNSIVRSSQKCQISVNNQVIEGNNQQPLLEQLEQYDIAIPYSCRAGICGKCAVILEQGEVKSITKSAIKKNGEILACSCIPNSRQLKIKLNNNKK